METAIWKMKRTQNGNEPATKLQWTKQPTTQASWANKPWAKSKRNSKPFTTAHSRTNQTTPASCKMAWIVSIQPQNDTPNPSHKLLQSQLQKQFQNAARNTETQVHKASWNAVFYNSKHIQNDRTELERKSVRLPNCKTQKENQKRRTIESIFDNPFIREL